MKKILFPALMVLLLAGASYAQNKGPVIRFETTEHDYGTIYQNADGSCEFSFTNVGDEPLILSQVRSSCGCTIPKWPKEPILPGQSGVITVTYDTKRIGVISKTIKVLSNATQPDLDLQIKGTVIQKPNEVLPIKPVNEGLNPGNNQ